MDPATRRALLKALRKVNIDTFLLELVEIITLELHGWQETPNMEHYEFVSLNSSKKSLAVVTRCDV